MKKETWITLGLIVLLLIVVVGISYAAFKFTGTGTKVNTITTGAISMIYTETDNVITLDKALPTTDKTGKTLSDYFEFTVSGNITGDTNINYEISAKAEPTNTFSGDNVKLYLTRVTDNGEEEVMAPEIYNEEANTNSFTGRPAGEMSLYTSSMNASESNTYRLRMYVTEEYNPQGDGGNKTFSVKINVYGKDGLSMEDRMMRTAGSEDFHAAEYKSKITSIITKGNTEIPSSGIIEQWDISEKQNGSVIAYIEDDGTGSGTYKLTIGGEEKIVANYDMSKYFDSFINLNSIDLTYLDTSLVTNMTSMFYGSSNLIELDLNNFDTSKVTNMSFMFSAELFSQHMSLKRIIFGKKFDTSNVTNMSCMFLGCDELQQIDLSTFNTRKVTSMSKMFVKCSSLTELDISSFDTSNVISADQMFFKCSSLQYLDLRNFDTSKLTNPSSYKEMFNYTTSITEILVTKDKWTVPNSTITNSGVTDFTYV